MARRPQVVRPSHGPALGTFAEKQDYLASHLANDLEWLLRAASHWHFQTQQPAATPGLEIQVIAMDSACLHARTLFEFFTSTRPSNNYCRTTDYNVPTLASRYGRDWSGPLHSHLMHMQARGSGSRLPNDDGVDRPLNEMPVMFAREIVRLWKLFADGLRSNRDVTLQPLADIADACLRTAVQDALPVFDGKDVHFVRVTPVAW